MHTYSSVFRALALSACFIATGSNAGSDIAILEGDELEVCQAYRASLEKLAPLQPEQFCSLGLEDRQTWREPNWIGLPIGDNLDIVQQITWLLNSGEPVPPPKELGAWKAWYSKLNQNGRGMPRLLQTKIKLDGEKEEYILAYSSGDASCLGAVKEFPLSRKTLGFGQQNRIFVFDPVTRKVAGTAFWANHARGELRFFNGKPYLFRSFWGAHDRKVGSHFFVDEVSQYKAPPDPYVFSQACYINPQSLLTLK